MSSFTIVCFAVALTSADPTAEPRWEHPRIKSAGEIVALPEAAFQPRAGVRVVFDVTAQDSPEKVAKGLDRVARFINLYSSGGVEPSKMKIAIVFHGEATRAVLSSEAYSKQTGVRENPHLELLRTLKRDGVQLYVCGQALAHHGYASRDVVPQVRVATAAMAVIVQSQMDGYSHLSY